MLLFKKYVLLLTLVALCSCGFTPLYKQTTDSEGNSSADEYAAVEIIVPHNLNGQAFKTSLTDLLNPTSKVVPAKYRFSADLNRYESALSVEQDRTVSRYKITVAVKYSLTEIATGKVVNQGTLRREGGYDRVASDYATYVSADDTTKRIIKELAADAKLKIISLIKK